MKLRFLSRGLRYPFYLFGWPAEQTQVASRQILHDILRTDTMQRRLKAHPFDPEQYLKTI